MDIVYSVKRIIRPDGKSCWGAYENNNLIDTFISKERAWDYIDYWKRVMR